ncbi:hypothetical protein H4R33_003651 [Dimargaris cristalligena]|nr:hypothetical protein H4R33_003651 [Dimargaris cristalligena]
MTSDSPLPSAVPPSFPPVPSRSSEASPTARFNHAAEPIYYGATAAKRPSVTNQSALEMVVAMITAVCRSIPTRALYHHLETKWRSLHFVVLSAMVACITILLSNYFYTRFALPYFQFRATGSLVAGLLVIVFLVLNAYILNREINLSRLEWVQRVNALVYKISFLHTRQPGPSTASKLNLDGGPPPFPCEGTDVEAALGYARASGSRPPVVRFGSSQSPTMASTGSGGGVFSLPAVPPTQVGEVHLGDNTNSHALAKTPLNGSVSAYSVIRDRELLLVPSALLCAGDFIVLNIGESLPGDATYVGPWVNLTNFTESYLAALDLDNGSHGPTAPTNDLLCLKAGQAFTPIFLRARAIQPLALYDTEGERPLYCCQHVFQLRATPFSDDLRSALAYEGCPNSVLDNQIMALCHFLLGRVLGVCFLLSVTINIIRFVLLDIVYPKYRPDLVHETNPGAAPQPWRTNALEYIGTYQIYVLLPFCGLALPLLIILARTYANAQILILLDALQHSKTDYEDSDDIDEFDMDAPPPTKNITVSKADVWIKFLQLLSRSDFRNLSRSNRLVESLGNTTVICAVDRDGTITRSFPAVDQILFIDHNNTMVSVDVMEDKIYTNGVAFEESGWERHLASLKPLGLNFLLNSNCGASLGRYRLDPHKRQNPLQGFCKIDAAQQTCLCRIGHEIGFTTEALSSFAKLEQISVLAPHHPSVPVLTSLLDPATPSMVSTVYAERTSGSNQLLSDGQVPLVLDMCSDYWDGKRVRPLTLAMKQEIIELYQNALENDIQTVAFAYRPIGPEELGPTWAPVPAGAKATQNSVCLELTADDHQQSSWRWLYRKPAQPHTYGSEISAARPSSPLSSTGTSPGMETPGSPAELSPSHSAKEPSSPHSPANLPPTRDSPSPPILLNDTTGCCTDRGDGSGVSSGCGAGGPFQPTLHLDPADTRPRVERDRLRALVQGQIFLGLTTLCPVPKVDVCDVIEDLGLAGIRFVYFSQARERESKAFAERLGLATDWNSCILLSSNRTPSRDPITAVVSPLVNGDAIFDDTLHPHAHATTTATTTATATAAVPADVDDPTQQLLPYYHLPANEESPAFLLPNGYLEDHDIKTQLPRGIENIRPHLADVDDIPLQVSLFAEANWEAMREMFRIYQEEGEVVCCIGSGLKASNPMNFATADFAIAIDPYPMGFRGLYRDATPEFSSPLVSLQTPRDVATSFHIGAGLISLPCSLTFQYDTSLYVLTQIIREARWLLSCIRQGGCFLIGIHVAVVLCLLLSYATLLPPVFEGIHILWILCFLTPLFGLPFLFVEPEPDIMTTMLVKNNVQSQNIARLFKYALVSFALPSIVCVFTYLIALQSLLDIGYADLYARFIYVNWSALTDESQWAILYAQTLTSCMFVYYMVCLSASFLHRTHFLIRKAPWSNRCWLLICPFILLCQCAFAAATMASGPPNLMDRLPWYYYAVTLVAPVFFVPFQELIKWHDKKHVVLFQKRSKLEFNTKLGLHSPI